MAESDVSGPNVSDLDVESTPIPSQMPDGNMAHGFDAGANPNTTMGMREQHRLRWEDPVRRDYARKAKIPFPPEWAEYEAGEPVQDGDGVEMEAVETVVLGSSDLDDLGFEEAPHPRAVPVVVKQLPVDEVVAKCEKVTHHLDVLYKSLKYAIAISPKLHKVDKWESGFSEEVVAFCTARLADESWVTQGMEGLIGRMFPRWDGKRAYHAVLFVSFFQALLDSSVDDADGFGEIGELADQNKSEEIKLLKQQVADGLSLVSKYEDKLKKCRGQKNIARVRHLVDGLNLE